MHVDLALLRVMLMFFLGSISFWGYDGNVFSQFLSKSKMSIPGYNDSKDLWMAQFNESDASVFKQPARNI